MTVAATVEPNGVKSCERVVNTTELDLINQTLLEEEINLLKVNCMACNQKFSCVDMLLQHRKVCQKRREEPNGKPHKCEQCNRSFRSMTGLRNHARTHTVFFTVNKDSLSFTPRRDETIASHTEHNTSQKTQTDINATHNSTQLDHTDLNSTYNITTDNFETFESSASETEYKMSNRSRTRRSGIPVAMSRKINHKDTPTKTTPREKYHMSRIRNKSGTPRDTNFTVRTPKTNIRTPRSRSCTPVNKTPLSRNGTPLGKNRTPRSGKKHTPVRKIYRCKKCGKTFLEKAQLEIHYTIHTRETPKKPGTPLCLEKKNTRRLQYKADTRREAIPKPADEKGFACTQCSRTYDKERYILSHMKTHVIETPYTCNMCDKRFKYASSMKAHAFVHIGEGGSQTRPGRNTSMTEVLARVGSSKQSTEIPVLGSNIFSVLSEQHINRNSSDVLVVGDFPYSCKSCDFKTRAPAELLKHMRTHDPSKNKPYRCAICDKSYSTKETLTMHGKIHTIARLKNMLLNNRCIKTSFSSEKHQSLGIHTKQ